MSTEIDKALVEAKCAKLYIKGGLSKKFKLAQSMILRIERITKTQTRFGDKIRGKADEL